jgi:hypothetical protein
MIAAMGRDWWVWGLLIFPSLERSSHSKRGGCRTCGKDWNGGKGVKLSFWAIQYKARGGAWHSSRLSKKGGLNEAKRE